jgi:hypothetical protein
MDEYESLSHSKWECKYHVIFIPKCRRKTLYKEQTERESNARHGQNCAPLAAQGVFDNKEQIVAHRSTSGGFC